RLNGAPVLIACTAREPEPACIAGLAGLAQVERLVLEPLDTKHTANLVREHLGIADGVPLPPALLEALQNRMGGNPLAAVQYVEAMVDAGLLRASWGSWELDTEGLERLELPTDVIQLLIRRIDDLGRNAKQVLTTAAVLGARFSLAQLDAVAPEQVAGV